MAANDERIDGKWVVLIADCVTHQFAGRLEISYDLMVRVDAYSGMETVRSFDAAGTLVASPASPAQLEGKLVTHP